MLFWKCALFISYLVLCHNHGIERPDIFVREQDRDIRQRTLDICPRLCTTPEDTPIYFRFKAE